eukprot:gnl/MRDRNA2_/MRDRNA2_26573_c0_seq1.p1 gnl/MRDRNA2_/MRDRNA2_26573_c0~~gnl/MRDRNA2_/MRDRNA2_26573_c0_seq1.p1  ORF type:complete len:434 (+),score=67.71 gnl/MRDRNA2_/MRDRNA2_26573_c0_seq1:77-1378(+)
MGISGVKPCCVSCETPAGIPLVRYCRCGEEGFEDIEDIKSDSKGGNHQDPNVRANVFGSPPGFDPAGTRLVSRALDALAEIPDAADTSHWPHESSETKLHQFTSNSDALPVKVSPRSESDIQPPSPCNSIPDDPSYFKNHNLRGLALIGAFANGSTPSGSSSQLATQLTNPKVSRDGAEADLGFVGPYDRVEAAATAAKIPLPAGLMQAGGSGLRPDGATEPACNAPITAPVLEACIIDPAFNFSANPGLLAPVRLDRPELPSWPKGVFIGCRMLVDEASLSGGEAHLVVAPVELSSAPALQIPVRDLCLSRRPGGGLDGLGALVHVELCTGATPEPDVLFCADFEQQDISEEFERSILAAARVCANGKAGVSVSPATRSPLKKKLSLVAEEPMEVLGETDAHGTSTISHSSCGCFPRRQGNASSSKRTKSKP